jgi:hypothetical protein
MKKTIFFMAVVSLGIAACNNATKPDGNPQTNSQGNDNTSNSDGTGHATGDKYDDNSMKDSTARTKGTTLQDSTSGLGGNRENRNENKK